MQILTEYINAEYEKSQKDNSGAIHPSSLDECNRKAIYQYRGVEKDLEHSDWLKAAFFHGFRIQEWMNEALEAKGVLIARNVPVRAEIDGVPVEGEIDHIVRINVVSGGGDLYSNSGWCIADTKSVHDGAFDYGDLPRHHHALQVGAYQWMLRQTFSRGVYGYDLEQEYPPMLFYVGRGDLHEEMVSAGDMAMEWALQKLKEIAHYINAEIVPPRPFKTPDEHKYLCSRCVSKGSRAKKDGTRTTPPVYVPSCQWFGGCWGVMPERWSFWSQGTGYDQSN